MKITWKDKWALFNYLRPSYVWLFLSFIPFLLGIYINTNDSNSIILIIYSILPFLFFFSYWGYGVCNTVLQIIIRNKQGDLTNLVNDFHQGDMIGCDQIRMGNMFILGYRTSTIIRYDEIKEFFNFIIIHKGQWRQLRIKTLSNKYRTICHHTTDKLSNEEISEVFEIIHSKNPSAHWDKPYIS